MQHNILRTARGVDGQPLRYGSLGGVLGGQKQLLYAVLHRGQRHWQHAGHGAQRAVQPQLTQKRPLTAWCGQLALRSQYAHKYRQVIYRPGLAHIGGGQIDRDAAGRPRIVQVFHGAAYPLAALLDGGVRQADQIELRQPARKISLDLHKIPRQPGHTKACHFCIHRRLPLQFFHAGNQRGVIHDFGMVVQHKLPVQQLPGLCVQCLLVNLRHTVIFAALFL